MDLVTTRTRTGHERPPQAFETGDVQVLVEPKWSPRTRFRARGPGRHPPGDRMPRISSARTDLSVADPGAGRAGRRRTRAACSFRPSIRASVFTSGPHDGFDGQGRAAGAPIFQHLPVVRLIRLRCATAIPQGAPARPRWSLRSRWTVVGRRSRRFPHQRPVPPAHPAEVRRGHRRGEGLDERGHRGLPKVESTSPFGSLSM